MKFRLALFSILLLMNTYTNADDLLEVYELAKKNDPAFGAAIAEYNAAIEASPKAFAAVLPQINLVGSHVEVFDEVINGAAGQDYDSDSYSLTLSQTIFNKARFDAIDQADALVAQAEANFGSAKHDLVIRVAQRYFDVLSESANLVFAKAEKKAIAQQLDQAKQRFKVGLTAITDVHEAQARYDQAVSQEIEAQRLYDISLEILREITGELHDNLAKVKEQQQLIAPNPDDIDTWIKTALDKNLLLLSAEKAMQAAMEGRELASAGHYPTLDLQADYTDFETEGGFRGAYEQDGSTVSLVLNIPIYSGGGTSATSREAAANLQRSKQLYEQQRRTTIRQVRNSYLTVLSAISQANALKQALRSTQTALEATQAGFEVGTRTTVDVLDSQREMYRAQRDYIRAKHGYILSTLLLKQAAGTLTETDVQLINTWLN
ncbi:MAG: TolC family outer membrane protein [Thioalkalispiraceae bacterium]|jgi:outer membrane protein